MQKLPGWIPVHATLLTERSLARLVSFEQRRDCEWPMRHDACKCFSIDPITKSLPRAE
ncbi:hypothetical protein BofuT4_uP114060.1 [Botrytis cinerea T4]|uniref:Uncharacterized protein n=1 Tax=Botryotinia fuckeliana (strain T4) TaxID=999810 RepID=G2Y5G2_BOTF4|nr:hypothetical protein BofuT4_uP114060.1 [Botrytis cinerea T4]